MERRKAKKESQTFSSSSQEIAVKVEKEKRKDLEVKSKEKGKEKGKEEEKKKFVEVKNKKGKEIGKEEEKRKGVGPKMNQGKEKEEKKKSVDVKAKENGKDKGKEEEKRKSVDVKAKENGKDKGKEEEKKTSVDVKAKENGKDKGKEEEKKTSVDLKAKKNGKDKGKEEEKRKDVGLKIDQGKEKEEEKRKSVDTKSKENGKSKGKDEKKINDVKGKENGSGMEAKKEQGTEKEKEQVTDQVKENSSISIRTLYPPPVEKKQILVLGLDGAGKTSVLHLMASNTVQHSTAPTQGFNAVHINSEDRQMEFLEIGGSEPFRSYWEMYLPKGWLLIFVVDSADHKRFPEAKKHLHQLIDPNPGLPLVVFANKQDLEAAYRITDIHDALALSEVGNDRKLFLFGTQVTKNGSEMPSTMQDAKDLIAHLAINM